MRHDLLWYAACAGYLSSLIMLYAVGGTNPVRNTTALIAGNVQAAAVFFVPSITIGEINDNYHGASPSPTSPEKKVRILIVPGHQPSVGGAVYKGVYERDLVVSISDALASLLAKNPHYEVMVSRSKTAWHPILQSYFETQAVEIEAFRQSQALQMKNYLRNGSILPQVDQVYHNTAPTKAVLQLYGINKWASDNAYDITLHLHINDYAGRRSVTADSYTGFSIYVPNHQYSNAIASRAISEAIAVRLNAYHATSTLPKEDVGVVEDQELIAIGSNNSTDAAAMLIEYGYIYEPQFQDPSIRQLALDEYAFQTYLGLQDFFEDPHPSTLSSPVWVALHEVKGTKDERGPSAYALQTALRFLGYYPPKGRSFSDCPISGRVGSCTQTAIRQYQKAHGLAVTGLVNSLTKEALLQETEEPKVAPSITLR